MLSSSHLPYVRSLVHLINKGGSEIVLGHDMIVGVRKYVVMRPCYTRRLHNLEDMEVPAQIIKEVKKD